MKNYRVVSNTDLNVIYAEFDTKEEAEIAIVKNDWNGYVQYKSDREIQSDAYEERKESRERALLSGIEIYDN